jgi:hypothetical protein
MTRCLTQLGVFALALTLIATPVAAQDIDVTGEWELSVPDPQGGGTVSLHLALAQEGTEVTGTVELSAVPDAEMSDGTVDGSTLSFGLHILFDGQWFTLWVAGAMDGDEISGSIELPEGVGSIPFKGARAEGVS